ncbi:hypothetical protein CHS0354_001071 [Potamilus streckersoni]|uniref:Peptidase M12B domain-containing protein n=1 Tax=Potamilus streckersoni TaxID=2493646 RepID=A0AAE0SU82_9BIVA|nr:hypothetical protein CHS0354_001071 [Potamilus streckersoni]
MILNGTKFIETISYLEDLAMWDLETGQSHLPVFDQAMLFTSYNLYTDSRSGVDPHGASYTEGVCEIAARTSVIQAVDYIWTVWATAHELGHSLGANHDGEKKGIACKAEDLYIMTPSVPYMYRGRPYSRNPWMFSKCSLEAFKQTLKDKDCVKTKGNYFNAADYKAIVTKKPGETITHNEQCHVIKGSKSVLCETAAADICLLMRCTDPATGICLEDYYGAASGTTCGYNMPALCELEQINRKPLLYRHGMDNN